jgi:hypothetical protein
LSRKISSQRRRRKVTGEWGEKSFEPKCCGIDKNTVVVDIEFLSFLTFADFAIGLSQFFVPQFALPTFFSSHLNQRKNRKLV